MLSKVLSKETCAGCKFCCAFRRCSLWETPWFEKAVVEKYDKHGIKFDRFADCGDKEQLSQEGYMLDYAGAYKTDSQDEEAPCAFLDKEKGCVLSDDEKPFDCKIWPLRIMRKKDDTNADMSAFGKQSQLVIALTPTCPAINKVDLCVLEEFVQDGLGRTIEEYAKEHPYIVKDYRDGFPVLMKL